METSATFTPMLVLCALSFQGVFREICSGSAVIRYFDALYWQGPQMHLPQVFCMINQDMPRQLENLERKALRTLAEMSLKDKQDKYSSEHEELDRLVLLFDEMFPHRKDVLKDFTLKRLKNSVPSLTVKPGIAKGTHSSRTTSTQSPWELECLNHHTTLKVAMHSNDDYYKKAAKGLCEKFVSQDFTFLPSLSGSRHDCLEKFWQLTVSAIVYKTFLDLLEPFEGKYILICY